jgi:hypothetical protein
MPDLALKYLETGQMVAISSLWIAKGGLAGVPEAKGLVPRVTRAHAGLVAATPAAPRATPPDVKKLMDALVALDQRHDHALRAVVYVLLAAAESALASNPPDTTSAASLTAASAALFPSGLAGTQASYLAEEGNGARAAGVVAADPALAALLGGIGLTKKASGAALFETYVALAAEVGAADRDKTAAGGDKVPATLLKARNTWAECARAVAAVLAEAEGAVAKKLLQALVVPAKKAAAAAPKPKKKSPAPAPVDPAS